jgi:hypothetical protein
VCHLPPAPAHVLHDRYLSLGYYSKVDVATVVKGGVSDVSRRGLSVIWGFVSKLGRGRVGGQLLRRSCINDSRRNLQRRAATAAATAINHHSPSPLLAARLPQVRNKRAGEGQQRKREQLTLGSQVSTMSSGRRRGGRKGGLRHISGVAHACFFLWLAVLPPVQLHDVDNDTGVGEEERVSPALVSSRHVQHSPHIRRHRATGTKK